MSAKFVVVSGGNPGAEFHLLTDRMVVGRSGEADVVLQDRAISRKHIEVYRDGVGYTVRDLSSGNGTFLNGSRIREAELINGDRVEVGSHVLDYQENPPRRQAHERQVVYRLDQGQPAGPAPAPPPAAAPAPAAPMPGGPRGQLQVPVPQKKVIAVGGGKAPPKRQKKSSVGLIAIILAIVGSLGGLGFLGVKLLSGDKTASSSAASGVEDHLAAGQAALESMNWAAARESFNAALESEPDNEDATTGLHTAGVEQRQQELRDEAERLISVGEYTQAIVNLRTVQSESELQSATAEARLNRLFEELITEGRHAVDRGDYSAAEAFARVVAEANPENPGARALLDEVSVRRGQEAAVLAQNEQPAAEEEEPEERSRSGRSDRSSRSDRRSRDRSSRSREDEPEEQESSSSREAAAAVAVAAVEEAEPDRSSRSSRRDRDEDPDDAFERGWNLHRAGDFEAAASFFDDYASNHDDELGDSAIQNAERVRSFATDFESGRDAYNESEWAIAVVDLRRAYSLDRRLEAIYQESIQSMLADSYFNLAQAEYDGGDYRDAGENARIALRYDSRHQDTLGLVRRLEEAANEMYINAVSFRESNPERARQLCRDIENMLPESSDLRRRAEELRSQL